MPRRKLRQKKTKKHMLKNVASIGHLRNGREAFYFSISSQSFSLLGKLLKFLSFLLLILKHCHFAGKSDNQGQEKQTKQKSTKKKKGNSTMIWGKWWTKSELLFFHLKIAAEHIGLPPRFLFLLILPAALHKLQCIVTFIFISVQMEDSVITVYTNNPCI